jgi:ribosomal protein S18 acetylase RimI-like enzyme
VGEALTRRVIERAGELGLRAVTLSSSQDMYVAHRLYERLGFRRTPEADWAPVPGVDLITYRLDL